MFKIDGKKITVSKSLELSPRQLYRLDNLYDSKSKQDYILSCAGISHNRVKIKKFKKYSDDKISNKNKNYYRYQFEKLLDNSADIVHAPKTNHEKSQWVGVEIECLIKRQDNISNDDECDDDNCEYCDGHGTVTCGNCEGDGTVTLRDHSGFEYEPTCAECDGDGNVECGECDGTNTRRNSNNRPNIYDKLRNIIRDANIPRCTVKQDGSLSKSGHTGVEVTLLFDLSQGFRHLDKLCKILNEQGAVVNETCGLHVHIDVRRLDTNSRDILSTKFGRYIHALSKLVPKSRRNNSFCKLGVSTNNDRYYAVNTTAIGRHGTIEIRLHSGTTNFEKISNWISLLKLVQAAEMPDRRVKTFQKLIDKIKLTGPMLEYFDRRFSKFNHDDEIELDSHDDEHSGIELQAAV